MSKKYFVIALKSTRICLIFPKGMANSGRTFSDVRNVILSAHKNTGAQDKVGFYETWAEDYEQVNLRQQSFSQCFFKNNFICNIVAFSGCSAAGLPCPFVSGWVSELIFHRWQREGHCPGCGLRNRPGLWTCKHCFIRMLVGTRECDKPANYPFNKLY